MITVHAANELTVTQLSDEELAAVAEYDEIRQAEITSIRLFLALRRHMFRGRVLDYGAGKPGTCREPQPYRYLMAEGADYQPWDVGDPQPIGQYDVILCTQVLQFVPDPPDLMRRFAQWMRRDGALVMTYPTNWPESESEDLWRFTRSGMDRMLVHAGFLVADHKRRAELQIGINSFSLGYGVVAFKR